LAPNSGSYSKGADLGVLILYIAFFGDCHHEILEVTSSALLTLSFQLLRDESSPSATNVIELNGDTEEYNMIGEFEERMPTKTSLQKATIFSTAMKEALQSSKFLDRGEKIGFPCFHLYKREVDLPQDAMLTKNVKASNLKLRRADALIAIAAARAGLKVSIMR